jgi:hypothetical protein
MPPASAAAVPVLKSSLWTAPGSLGILKNLKHLKV